MSIIDALMPLVRLLPAETAHDLAISTLERGWVPPVKAPPPVSLGTRVWHLVFDSPIGLAAGFDKDGRVPRQILSLGFGFAEVGSVTPKPQPGNPKPRLFRLTPDRAVINRFGFNNQGHAAMEARLERVRALGNLPGVLGVNLGKNKDAEDDVADYVRGVEVFAAFADYLVVNVSSPNTPGLRMLQDRGPLERLLSAVRAARDAEALDTAPPLLVKIAPDLADEDLVEITDVVRDTGFDGIIATNTTIARPDSLVSSEKGETGGLSGRPLMQRSTEVIHRLYELTSGNLPIIGVGGVASGADAYTKIRAGASLVQLYSALVYEGPYLASRINRELAELLARDGLASVGEAVGADHRSD